MEPNGVELYGQMLKSRLFEEAVTELWRQGYISAEMHLNIGEEGIVAGVVDHLIEGDAMALDHRGTSPLVMRGIDLVSLLKEFMGEDEGLCHGMGGHMHLFAPDLLAASSGIVGASGPAACGFALANQHLRRGNIAVAFFGEAAMNQGMLMESINLAAVWSLPVLFVCKDNGMGITTPSEKVTGGDLCTRARGLGAHAVSVDGSDVGVVWHEAKEAVDRARKGKGPSFLLATCRRPEGHFLGDPLLRIVRKPVDELRSKVGPLMKAATSGGASVGSRAASLGSIVDMLGRAGRMRKLGRHDPLRRQAKRLSDAEQQRVETAIEEEVGAAVRTAMQSMEAPS
ncbi:MAG: thiamine pyrophosphate-dependent dehydrogenase E1 component subunit alpha [Polyangiales bacterium]